MGLLDFLKRKHSSSEVPPVKSMMQRFRACNPDLYKVYRDFYEEEWDFDGPLYGFMEWDTVGLDYGPPVYQPELEFPFEGLCFWELMEDEEEAARLQEGTYKGCIPIANLGCNATWVLVTTGAHAGEVWLDTEMGITPVREHFDLAALKEAYRTEGPEFWYEALKEWVYEDENYFTSHAIVKNVRLQEEEDRRDLALGGTTCLCLSCMKYMQDIAVKWGEDICVADPRGVHIFGSTGESQFYTEEELREQGYNVGD